MFAAVFAILVCNQMSMLACHACGFVRSLFCLTNSHRRVALQGQHCDREPEEKVNEEAHCLSMVPQIKNVHQGMAIYVVLRRPDEDLGMLSKLIPAGLYRL